MISQICENGIQSQNRFTCLMDHLLVEHMKICIKIIILLLKRRFFINFTKRFWSRLLYEHYCMHETGPRYFRCEN